MPISVATALPPPPGPRAVVHALAVRASGDGADDGAQTEQGHGERALLHRQALLRVQVVHEVRVEHAPGNGARQTLRQNQRVARDPELPSELRQVDLRGVRERNGGGGGALIALIARVAR
jgi:hypothetical protein